MKVSNRYFKFVKPTILNWSSSDVNLRLEKSVLKSNVKIYHTNFLLRNVKRKNQQKIKQNKTKESDTFNIKYFGTSIFFLSC